MEYKFATPTNVIPTHESQMYWRAKVLPEKYGELALYYVSYHCIV